MLTLDAVVGRLEAALAEPLPGPRAQLRMARAPRPELEALPERTAGVLVLLYPAGGQAHLVLTVRTQGLRRHQGQVSLPGGLVEPGETPLQAALRESAEEIGVEPARLRVLGALTPLRMPHGGFVVHPFVAAAPERPALAAAELEVARVLEVPLSVLTDPSAVRVEPRPFDEGVFAVPYFEVDGEKVWGATAMVLAELLWLLGFELPAVRGLNQ